MGYLIKRGYLRDLEELREHLPEGWTFNTPCFISFEELEDFREVSHSNQLFRHMLATGRSIARALNGPDCEPCQAEILREQKIAAEMWAEALDDEVTGWYHHHPHESGAYVHTMWSRANDREEASQAIFAVDVCEFTSQENKEKFYYWVKELTRKQRENTNPYKCSGQHGNAKTNGLTRSITTSSSGYWWSREGKRWTRGINHGYKPRGKSMADKRKAELRDTKRPSRAVWVTKA